MSQQRNSGGVADLFVLALRFDFVYLVLLLLNLLQLQLLLLSKGLVCQPIHFLKLTPVGAL